VLKELTSALSKATSLPEQTISKALVKSNDINHGDFAFPCFILAKEWKVSPPEAAKKLHSSITLPGGISRTEIVGPYLNFFLDRSQAVKDRVTAILEAGQNIGTQDHRSTTYIVEYSSPNIAKPFHLGHLRTTLIGLALDRIYRHLGYHVVSINHLGDWGTQFGFVYAGCKLWGKPENPTVDELVSLYRRANALRKAQDEKNVPPEDADKPEVNQMARDFFVRLEAEDPEAHAFWKWALDISMEYYLKVYDRLGVHFDHYTGESFYRDKLEKVEADLKASGILVDSKGALGVELDKKLGFVRVFTEDGRSLYMTRDLATADYRYRTFNPDRVFIVLGNPQELYLKQLCGVLEKMKHPMAGKIVHVSFGHVPGISTRKAAAGDEKISLASLLDDAHERALDAYRTQVEKKPEGLNEEEVAEAVGLGAVFFDYLSRTNNKDFHFDWDTALSFQGDTGPYILYALARLNSIEAKARESGITVSTNFDPSKIADDDSYRLVALLSRLDDVLAKAAEEHEPYHVALYALELAKTFSGVYRKLRVVGEEAELAKARLALFMATRTVLQTSVTLIGMKPVARM
jgi:arginyl-tRNA synthetase